MYKILFSENGPMVCIAKGLKIEDAIQFALNLHRSSNVSHTVFVFGEDKESAEIILESK